MEEYCSDDSAEQWRPPSPPPPPPPPPAVAAAERGEVRVLETLLRDRTNREAALYWNAKASPSGAAWQEGLRTRDAAAQNGEDSFWGCYTGALAPRAAAPEFAPGMQCASAADETEELRRLATASDSVIPPYPPWWQMPPLGGEPASQRVRRRASELTSPERALRRRGVAGASALRAAEPEFAPGMPGASAA